MNESEVVRGDRAHPDNAPEVSVRTTSTLLLYFERRYGAARLADVFRRHSFSLSLDYLRTATNFISLPFLEKLADVLVAESGDAQFMRKAGLFMAGPETLGFAYYMVRAFGSLEICFRKTVELSSSFNRVGQFEIEELARERLVLSYRSSTRERHRHICELRMGQFASFPTIWGLPPAEVTESQCHVLGADVCRYHLRWTDPLPMWGRYIGLLLGAVSGVGTSILGLGHPAFSVTALSLAGVSLGSWLDLRREMRRKDEALNEQTHGMMGSLEELQQRYDEMFRINVALEDRVAARTRELTESNARLEAALAKQKELDRLKSEFFDNVSHELRTPLTLILLTLDSLLQRGPEVFAPPVRQHLETMNRSASRLLRLINNLLDLTKLEAGKTKLRHEPLEIESFLSSLLVPFEVLADKKGVALELEGHAPTPVQVDVARLESVFQNLISNALKFTLQGRVTVRLHEDDTWVHVEVIDTGVGIATQDLSVIFDRFAQADSSGTRRFGGTGIGLALVKETLELHKGGIDVSSELGKGSNFHVRLRKGPAPVREAEPELPPEPVLLRPLGRSLDAASLLEPEGTVTVTAVEAVPVLPPDVEAGPDAPRVLLVEDEPEIRSFLRQVLKPYYRLLDASNGEEGLSLAQKERPDLIISDVMMPVMSGLQMLAALRASPETVDTPLILLTARQEVEAKVEGLTMGANDYLPKPFSPREMLARVEAQLRLRDAAIRAAENERLAATGLLTSGFAHEVRNPLNGLMNALLPLRESLTGTTPDIGMAVGMLELIEECGQRIRHLAEGLLSFVRTGTKAMAVDLGASLDASVQALSWRLSPDLKVERDYQCAEPVWSDPGSLNQVWVNLLDNAVRAVAKEGGRVRVVTSREGSDAVVSIIDNGVGIKPENMDRVFQPFFSTRDAGEGTGLGLALCQRIVLQQGGRIRIFSEYGKGTRVEVRLPLEADPDRLLPPLLSDGRVRQHHWNT
ncbi:Adenylate cyclase [Cystobacter fuscus DSM 2262]|uniref:histidine kinase n=1 Tax=Cystobacter fuscus (strain ATCC 25194 / DSM 2262 / NBRC 100088 / M29) TaxID=1242864 RepID=S9R4C6_CYSF2|nr:ATP-binding protein [Cystobacter fuscus]EPX63738.1 Adenylate cyclase [Cystobacter fuscus DSM 2262]